MRLRWQHSIATEASGDRPHKNLQPLLIAALLASFVTVPARLRSEPLKPLVMATNQPDTTYEGKWQRRVYQMAATALSRSAASEWFAAGEAKSDSVPECESSAVLQDVTIP